ncbi:MAG: T9SS type A sorting domain-containing protein [Flavobacteriaceae bacterium]|jgi:hypothetical protein|nr:T9SS type A sorting domain-containing protein [Flavobacteriaceae bacterium]
MKKFFPLLALLLSQVQAESQITGKNPGGVSGAVLWMKTNAVTKDLNGNYRWQDYSGDSARLTYYNTNNEYQASKKTNFSRMYNFQPGLLLTSQSLSKEIEIKSGNLSTMTLIGVTGEHTLAGEHFSRADYLMTINGVKGKGFVLDKDKIIHSTESSRGVFDYGKDEGYDLMYHPGLSPEENLTGYKERTLRSFTYYRSNRPVTGIWGERRRSHLSLGEKFYSTNQHNNSSYDTGLFNPNNIFNGYLPELIIYDRILSPLERIKAESYLALKYGFMLESSYLGSEGQLLWDPYQEKVYNHRVTAIYRDDKSGLYQNRSGTSYEEAPHFSYSPEGESHDNQDNYGLSNRNKLLVIERFPCAPLHDREYLIWGDNDQSIKTVFREDYLGMKIMERNWLVKTNMGGKFPVFGQMQWEVSSNLTAEKEGYKLNIKKSATTETLPGILSSAVPLPGYEGHISFTLSNPLGLIIVKFGTKSVPEQNGSNDYGIFINEKGEVYPIVRGYPQWNNRWNVIVKSGDRIRINKTKDAIIVSSNGWALPQTGQSLPQIFIDPQDIEKDFYVNLGIYQWNQDTAVKDFRTGGFIDTGNRIELSYIDTRATDFTNYASNGQAYMLVDRSGTGEFKKEDTEMYVSDEYDAARKKIVFNNVFFDTDANDRDVFTFGYRETNLIANIEKTSPGCNNGDPQQDGSITVQIVKGDPGFEYQLINNATSQVEKEGVFFTKELKIENLSSGEYTFKLKEIGGFHIASDDTSNEHKSISHQSIDWDRGGLFETTIKSTNQNFQMGLVPQSNPSDAANILQYGFEIKQGQIYIITNQEKSTVPQSGVYIKEGDKVQIYKNYNEKSVPYRVDYKINGVIFYTQQNLTGYRFFMLKNLMPQDTIYNIRNTDGSNWFGPKNWNYHNSHSEPQAQNLSETGISHTLSLLSECNKSTPEIQSFAEQNNVIYYYQDYNDKSKITAKVTLKSSSPVSLAVFDLSGALLHNQYSQESKKEHTLEITGLPPGVYLSKIFSAEGEYTQKIIIQ